MPYSAKLKKQTTEKLNILMDEICALDLMCSVYPSPERLKRRLFLQTEFNLATTKQAEYLILKSISFTYGYSEKTGKRTGNS